MKTPLRPLVAALGAVLSLTASATEPAPPPPKPTKIIAFDFTAQGDAPATLGRVLGESAARELAKLEGTQVLTQADVSAQLGAEIKQTGNCADDRACMAEVAGAMDADRNLTGTVTQIGDTFVIALTLVDARKMSTVGGAQETIKAAKPEQLLDAARRLAYRAYTGKLLETTGAIEFDVAESGARVLLDGKEIGTGPFRETQRISEGMHAVTVMKTGFVTWETTVKVEAGGRSAVAPKLVEGEGGRNGPVYVEFGMSLLNGLVLPLTGLDWCSDKFDSKEICGGGFGFLRLGFRVDSSFSAEATLGFMTFRWWHSPQANDFRITQDGVNYGIAGVWNPNGNRHLGVAAELGLLQGTFSDGMPLVFGMSGVVGGPRTMTFNAPYGEIQGRLDYAWGRFQVGLRVGLLAIRFPKTFTSQVASPVMSVNEGLALLLDLGFVARVWF